MGDDIEINSKTMEQVDEQRFQFLRDIATELSGNINFPTNFNLVIRLRDILNDPNWTFTQVANLLSVEPLIASRLVGLANSAAYRTGRGKITDVHTAVKKLGIHRVRSAAMAITTQQFLNAKSMRVFNNISQQFWAHSLRTASAAYVLCKHHSHYDPEEAMLVGMIHDLGVFYLLYRASKYEYLSRQPEMVKQLVIHWHEHIGHALLIALRLSEDIAAAVREHDTPRPVPTALNNLSDIIYVANLIGGGGFEWDYLQEATISADQAIASLDPNFTDLTEEINEFEAEVQSMFS